MVKNIKTLVTGDIIICHSNDISDDLKPQMWELQIIEFYKFHKAYQIKTVKGWHKERPNELGYEVVEKSVDDRPLAMPKAAVKSSRGRSVE